MIGNVLIYIRLGFDKGIKDICKLIRISIVIIYIKKIKWEKMHNINYLLPMYHQIHS